MEDYRAMLERIRSDERYQRHIKWGEPRQGHPEGTIEAHIRDLEANLEKLKPKLTESEYWRLKVLIHVHDTFKAEAPEGIPIHSPDSHASKARQFLSEFTNDDELLRIVQHHDEPLALFQRPLHHRPFDKARFERLMNAIHDWDVFLAFINIDGSTPGKKPDQLLWFFRTIRERVQAKWTAEDILNRPQPKKSKRTTSRRASPPPRERPTR